MLRLFKLAAYAFFGYALYEFFRGLTEDIQRPRRLGQMETEAASDRFGARQEGRQRLSNDSGDGRRTVSTQEQDGGEASYAIGRGVVRDR